MQTQERPLKDFLQISYTELEKMNMELKDKRRMHVKREDFQKELKKYLGEEKRLKAVTVCFTDIEGKLLMLDYNKTFLLESEDNLTFDGSSIRGFTAQSESDLRLKIDWSSFRWLPSDVFGPGKVIVFANVHDKSGEPYESDFRGQLMKYADELYEKEDMVAHVSTEIEGILLQGIDAEQNFDHHVGFELVTKGGYYNALPQDPLRKFIDAVAEAKRALGFENEKDHPEVAPSQFELNYKYCDVLQAADNVQIYKLVCRQVAKNMGYTATFLPKPRMNINGSGMHTNISLSKDGKNMFFDASDEFRISADAHAFLRSILHHAKDICLTINSSVNAYRRLDPHFEAPNEIKVSPNDRGSMIRIPLGNEKSARIEVRSVAPDTNPYLGFYTLIKTGMKGIQGSQQEREEHSQVLQKREKLPGNIYDALRYFKKSEYITALLGENNQTKFADWKEASANRCPKDLGTRVKLGEVVYHHDVTNQVLWNQF